MPRRLPVLQNTPDGNPSERGAAYRIGAGALAAIAIWVPLALLGAPFGARVAALATGATPGALATGAARWSRHDAARFAAIAALPIVLAFGLAAFGAGVIVARLGGPSPRRDAALASSAAAFLVVLVAGAGRAGPTLAETALAFVVFGILGAGCGVAGASFGARNPGSP
jgi:hypothetical protein